MSSPYHLFISYQKEQAEWVAQFAKDLESRLAVLDRSTRKPFKCFYYTDSILPGDHWHRVMLQHAETAPRFIFIFTERSYLSNYCILELDARLQRDVYDTTLFVLRDGTRLSHTPMRYRKHLDLTDPTHYAGGLEKVVAWLCQKKANDTVTILPSYGNAPLGPASIVPPLKLAEASQRFVCSVGSVLDRSTQRPLGWAWRSIHNEFLCTADILRPDTCNPTSSLAFQWRDQAHVLHSLGVIETCPAPNEHGLATFRVVRGGRLPDCLRPARENEETFFDDGTLAALVNFPQAHSPAPFVQGVPVMIGAWNQPGQVRLALRPDQQIHTGSPVFDSRAQLLGYLTTAPDGQLIARPL